ncbi:mitotic spindle checkpoint protein BUBR1-like isoform X2 [Primulina eburnea]|uniref:mitotic spindle checkpoint protein BUBR1-like isoform X2 n=1 Tax=Primulina eburnea TaxID=1245227 RepID=UPI003C6C82D2
MEESSVNFVASMEPMLDPESQFLVSKEETGHEWELFKENVRHLKRGRNVNLLNQALKFHSHSHLKKSLLHNRRRLIEAIDQYEGDDPLQPWIECIKWVQEAFPPGGDYSGLVVIYEQCVRTFWHEHRYKDDLRYLKVWLEYAENCVDAEVIYNFLEANKIGQTHAQFYISYGLLMEHKHKTKTANDIYNRGLSMNAQPVEDLKAAYKKFLSRSMRQMKTKEEDAMGDHLPARSFGTVLAKEARNQSSESSDLFRKN